MLKVQLYIKKVNLTKIFFEFYVFDIAAKFNNFMQTLNLS